MTGRLQVGLHRINGAMIQGPMDWRYLPYVKAYARLCQGICLKRWLHISATVPLFLGPDIPIDIKGQTITRQVPNLGLALQQHSPCRAFAGQTSEMEGKIACGKLTYW